MNIEKLIQRAAVAVALLVVVGVAKAQTAPVVNLSVTPASGIGSVTPTITWSTSPAATSCTASGDWSGTKAASGTTTLAAVTASKSYTLTCVFPTTGSVQVQWVPPTTNTDGSALANLSSYHVYVGSSATTLADKQLIAAPASTATVPGLANGTWFFAVSAVSATGKESAKSNVVTKTIAPLSASDTETVTVTPDTTPNPPTNLTVVDPIAYNLRVDYGRFAFLRGTRAGKVALGTPCDETRVTADGYNAIKKRGSVLVAKCAAA